MPIVDREARNAYARRLYHKRLAQNRRKNREAMARWRTKNPNASKEYYRSRPRKSAFDRQKANAKRRGIEFLLTFAEFCEFWGSDFSSRGRGNADLCMARFGDAGSYAIGNVVKLTNAENKARVR